MFAFIEGKVQIISENLIAVLCNLYFAIFLTFIIMIIGLILRVKINSFIKEK